MLQETALVSLSTPMAERAAPPAESASPELIARAQRGDLPALTTLYDQHHNQIYRYLRARLGDVRAAEDLTGEVFQRMLTSLAGYRPQGLPFRAWLFRIAHNLLVDHYRRAGKRLTVEWDERMPLPDHSADPADRTEHNLVVEQVQRAMARLEDGQRETLMLRFLSGLSLRETALTLGKSEEAVKALQRRGLAALRRALQEAGYA